MRWKMGCGREEDGCVRWKKEEEALYKRGEVPQAGNGENRSV
jgi:hypothetical protein